ncbi:MAG: family 78 glycoside hydrolase catalytic domain [Clostridia bacterium]|nr:family 78 glycoside hydrolase catalytic domain [Clostridia bacterium]
MTVFEKSKWIWKASDAIQDEYVNFTVPVAFDGKKTVLRLCADSDFNVLVNGKLVAFGQYQNYEENAYYEEADLTPYLKMGENQVEILVWYIGAHDLLVYSVGKAGLIFELLVDGKVEKVSDETILSAYHPCYKRGYQKLITVQLGYSFYYDAQKEKEPLEYAPSVIVDKPLPRRKRPVSPLNLEAPSVGVLHENKENKKYIFDFGKEIVGFLSFRIKTAEPMLLTFTYSEYLSHGIVNRFVGKRDYSMEYYTKSGENDFYYAFRRLACRYIAVEADQPFEVEQVAILPTNYPLTEKTYLPTDPLRQRIYEICIRTLRLCMHEHYEDCPGREQALYIYDSRNQMLCGYYAFGNYEYAKQNIRLIAESREKAGLFPLTVPGEWFETIPSFALHFFTTVREYLQHTEDIGFVREVYPRLLRVFKTFRAQMDENGLLKDFEVGECWNFYDWQNGIKLIQESTPNLLLNLLYVRALQEMSVISRAIGREDVYYDEAENFKERIRRCFYDETLGLYVLKSEAPLITEYGNYLSILTETCPPEDAEGLITRLLAQKDRVPLTLSMRCFQYDAMLKVDREKYKPVVLADIDARWKQMLDAGSTTCWETEERVIHDLHCLPHECSGYSRCHGWSAIPVYYYHTLLEENEII